MVDVTFRDATGGARVLWHRDHAGQLSEVLENQQVT